jgi:hypothetical protein
LTAEGSGDIFPEGEAGVGPSNNSNCDEKESTAFSLNSGSFAGDTEILTGRTEHNQIDGPESDDLFLGDFLHVPQVGDVRPVVL